MDTWNKTPLGRKPKTSSLGYRNKKIAAPIAEGRDFLNAIESY